MKLTVDQVLAEANTKLDELGIELPETGRAGQRVDVRTFRHYRSQGLVDPPDEKQGTAGLYGKRHVAQLVAIKALQAQWVPLDEIRKKLANAGTAELTVLARRKHARAERSSRRKTRRRPAGPRTWVELRINDDAYVMVDKQVLEQRRPSELRTLGQRLASLLVSAGT